MNKKPFYKSKTVWFNTAIAVFAVFSSHLALLHNYVGDGGYLALMMFSAGVNTVLRAVTTQGVSLK